MMVVERDDEITFGMPALVRPSATAASWPPRDTSRHPAFGRCARCDGRRRARIFAFWSPTRVSRASRDFVYKPEENVYRCPAGEALKCYTKEEKGQKFGCYWTNACRACDIVGVEALMKAITA
jgi:hypothetical protein